MQHADRTVKASLRMLQPPHGHYSQAGYTFHFTPQEVETSIGLVLKICLFLLQGRACLYSLQENWNMAQWTGKFLNNQTFH